jgi:hypothetical protein
MFTNLPLSIFGMLIEQSSSILALNILALLPLVFVFLTSLYGLFNLKLSGFYSMHNNRHTDSVSLLFLTSFMCRIGFPLCLNFVQILKIPNFTTSLESMMGVTDLVPVFGKSFSIFYPVILIIFFIFHLFDGYGKIMNFFGFYSFGFTNPYHDDKVEEGLDILHTCKIC